jgi:citrate lyase subunit beta/citryl-CoA lyase
MIETTAHTETGAETVRLRRSVLFMPGSNERALIKARSLSADAIIMDLEDAVAPDSKAAARDQITKALREGGYGSRECIVRVNALDTPWGEDDLRAVAHMNVHAVLIPKVEHAHDIIRCRQRLAHAGACAELPIWAMLETPTAVFNARQISAACAHLTMRKIFVLLTRPSVRA